MKFLDELFKLINDNKNLPYYQAERRIDIFINLFLAEILNHQLKKTNIKYVLPELALKKEKNNLSTKVDYLCFDEVEEVVYFVELKTEVKSFDKDQFNIYQNYKSWGKCIKDIEAISSKTKEKQKFALLNNKLARFNLLDEKAKSFKIELIYMAPECIKIKDKIIELDKISNTTYITFNSLKEFKSKEYPAEWDLFYSNCIEEIQKQAFLLKKCIE